MATVEDQERPFVPEKGRATDLPQAANRDDDACARKKGLASVANGSDDRGESEALALTDALVTEAFSAGTMTAYSEPWLKRVREVDDDTLDPLLRFLVALRRIRGTVTLTALTTGALLFGIPRMDASLAALMIYGTLALTFAMPVHAVGALAVRRLFLREARRHGLSRSASLLLLTRAERRARHLFPILPTATVTAKLKKAVRDPDLAD